MSDAGGVVVHGPWPWPGAWAGVQEMSAEEFLDYLGEVVGSHQEVHRTVTVRIDVYVRRD